MAQFAMVANGVTTGSVYSVFESLGTVDASGQRYFVRWTTADGGASWRIGRANLDLDGAIIRTGETGRFFQGVLTLPTGDLVAPFYAGQADGHSAAYLLTMPKGGTTWTRSATSFLSAAFNYSESSATRLTDGRLLMITRQDDDPTSKVIHSRLLGRITNGPVNSAVDLKTASWGAAFAVKVPGAPDANAVRGVAPVVNTMEGGILMLVFGRPQQRQRVQLRQRRHLDRAAPLLHQPAHQLHQPQRRAPVRHPRLQGLHRGRRHRAAHRYFLRRQLPIRLGLRSRLVVSQRQGQQTLDDVRAARLTAANLRPGRGGTTPRAARPGRSGVRGGPTRCPPGTPGSGGP